MAKYKQIMDGLGVDTTLFAESIPHLFHQDLVYLWILEASNRPNSWQERVKAWKCLVELLLSGELKVDSEDITLPLLDYTTPYGVTKTHWLSLKNTDEVIGVLSPTVLVRPLPDLTQAHLETMEQRRSVKPSPNVFRHFVQLAVDDLRRGGKAEGSFGSRLAEVLESEFQPHWMTNPPSNTSLQVPILDEILWGRAQGSLSLIDILLPGGRENIFVPLCIHCQTPLTRTAEVEAVNVANRDFQVYCQKEECGLPNNLDLYDFLLWDRDQNNVVLWDKEGVLPVPEKGLPPKSTFGGGEIIFEWDSAQIRGEREKRFLKLKFLDRTIGAHKIDSVFFQRILLPGEVTNFSGLPVRPEWLDILEEPTGVAITTEIAPPKVTYRNIKIKGLPISISKVFGSSAIHIEPSLAVGVYPDPQFVPPKWKWYRFFLDGSKRKNYTIETTSGISVLPWLWQTSEYQSSLSVISRSDPATGITFWEDASQKVLSSQVSARIPLGIDFGTTNTMVYFLPPSFEMKDVRSSPGKYCFEPSKLSEVVLWIAKTSENKVGAMGDFLPLSTYGDGRADPYLIPTLGWSCDDKFLIRWASERPTEQARVERGFKWDKPNVDSSGLRRAYITEVLLLGLPFILRRSLEDGKLTTWDLTFDLGFAFPLSFDYEARGKTKSMYQEIKQALAQFTGFNYEVHSLNESLACTRLLGSLNQTATFLVADMGGGTIDLALFVGNPPSLDQIGSIQFAGETYVDVFTEKRGLEPQDVRDLIFNGKCHREYGGDQTANKILRRFIGVTFEFLRTMVAAHRKQNPDQRIDLVLAGNGWHLVEAFSDRTKADGGERVFSDYFDELVKKLNDSNFTRTTPVSGLPTYKHLVAIGALQNASKKGGDELSSPSTVIPQLPAGRGLIFGDPNLNPPMRIEWSELVGGPVSVQVASAEALKQIDVRIDLGNMSAMPNPWRGYVLSFFGASTETEISMPQENNLREEIRDSISQADPPSLRRGPLQIILEMHGVEWLKE
jgi:hypothetical protein